MDISGSLEWTLVMALSERAGRRRASAAYFTRLIGEERLSGEIRIAKCGMRSDGRKWAADGRGWQGARLRRGDRARGSSRTLASHASAPAAFLATSVYSR